MIEGADGVLGEFDVKLPSVVELWGEFAKDGGELSFFDLAVGTLDAFRI